jgi:NADH-quinone oxidoreductase subunit F
MQMNLSQEHSNRYLMEFIPHLLIEGMITSSFALGANLSYIYIRGEYMWVYKILERAIAEAKAAGFLGKIFRFWF